MEKDIAVQVEETQKTGNRFYNWWKRYYVYVISSLIIIAAVTTILAVKGFWPFGKGASLLSGDFFLQGWPYAAELKDKLANGESVFHTWGAAFGANFFSNIVLYLNPFLLVFVLVPTEYVLQISTITFVVTLLLLNGTMLYFLTHRPKHALPVNRISNMLFSLSFTLCTYVVSNVINWNFMATAVCFPLILLGLERFVANKGWKLYFFSLALAFFSCYYFAGLFCIFILLYYLTLEFESFRYFVQKSWKVILISAAAILVSGILLVPVFIQMLGQTYSISSYEGGAWFTSFWDILQEFFVFNKAIDIGSASDSYGEVNLYYGLLPLMLTSFYFLNPKIKRTTRLKKLLLTAVYLIAFDLNGLNYIMHMFHYPSWFPNRFSWFFTLYCIILASESWTTMEKDDYRMMTVPRGLLLGIGWAVVTVLCFAFAQAIGYQFVYTYSIGLFLFYMVAMLLLPYLKGKEANVLAMIGCVEIICSFGYSVIFRQADTSADRVAQEVMENREFLDTYATEQAYGFSRILPERDVLSEMNSGLIMNYNAPTIFASSIGNIGSFLEGVGVYTSNNSIQAAGYTQAVMSMLNIQYIYCDNNVIPSHGNRIIYTGQNDPYGHYPVAATEKQFVLYENPTVLSMGYMVDKDAQETWKTMIAESDRQDRGIADNINVLTEATSGISGVMEKVDLPIKNLQVANCQAIVKDHHWIAAEAIDTETLDMSQFEGEGSAVNLAAEGYDPLSDSYLGFTYQADQDGEYFIEIDGNAASAGYLKAGEEMQVYYEISASDFVNGQTNGMIQISRFNEEQWQKAYDVLSRQQMTVTDATDSEIQGTVNAEKEGILFTSIPYEKNWHVYVDGEEQEILPLWNSLVSVKLPAGEHDIRIVYRQSGLAIGAAVSCVMIVLVVGYMLWSRRKGKDFLLEKTSENANEKANVAISEES